MATIDLPPDFRYDEVQFYEEDGPPRTPPGHLGVLAKFKGRFKGTGFNTIFCPNSGPPPRGTPFPHPVQPTPPDFPSDNVLELNLTTETITFCDKSLGNVPNRGFRHQDDINLDGVPYVQAVNDVTNRRTGKGDHHPTGIHFETGLWMNIPATHRNPILPDSLVRMGSIPHGTTINAQSFKPVSTIQGPPNILPVSLKPFPVGQPHKKLHLHSLNIERTKTPRLPQHLEKFNAAGTITQDILDDPNTVLRNSIIGQNIIETTVFTVSTDPPLPEFGGGTANIAFLEGSSRHPNHAPPIPPIHPNAKVIKMEATFWVETVEYSLTVPVFKPGQAPMEISAPESPSGQPRPVFLVSPPYEITSPKTINVTSTQIQYSQVVCMNFDQITWPHVSVSTLVPSTPVPVPDSVWG